MNTQPKPIIVQPGAGKNLDFGPAGESSVMLSGEQTGGTLAVLLNTDAEGGGPPPHVHSNDDELFLVIDGHYSFFSEGRWTEVSAGGVVYLPKGTVHAYRNNGPGTGRLWVLTTPSGFERFFARYAAEVSNPAGPDMQRIVDISREYGIEYVEADQS